jgi:uncharacterized membrane protein
MRKANTMADLIAIGYPDEATADAAADEARRLAADLIIQPDASNEDEKELQEALHGDETAAQ